MGQKLNYKIILESMKEAMDRSHSHKQEEKFVHYEDTLPVKLAFLVTLCAACVCTAYVVILTNQTTETMGNYEALFPAMRGQLLRNIDTGIAERGPFSLLVRNLRGSVKYVNWSRRIFHRI